MKNITITNKAVIINCGGNSYEYPLIQGSLTVTKEQVEAMPDGVKVIIIFLAAAKKLRIKNNYESIREPIWRNLDLKQGGLSKNGQKAFGEDAAVVAAAEVHQKYLKGRVAAEVPAPSTEIIEKSAEAHPPTHAEQEGESDTRRSLKGYQVVILSKRKRVFNNVRMPRVADLPASCSFEQADGDGGCFFYVKIVSRKGNNGPIEAEDKSQRVAPLRIQQSITTCKTIESP